MRDHETCDEAISEALAAGHPGKAEFLATRCDREHGRYTEQPTTPTTDRAEVRETLRGATP